MSSTAALVDAVIATLTEHLGSYLHPYLTKDGRATLSLVDWRPSRDLLNREALPVCLVEWAGTVDDPEPTGRFQAQWNVDQAIGVSIYDRGSNYADVQRRLAYWTDAVRDCLLAPEHKTLGGLAESATYLGTEPGLFDDDKARTLDGAAVVLSYAVPEVLGGPVTPTPGAVTVLSVSSSVTAREG